MNADDTDVLWTGPAPPPVPVPMPVVAVVVAPAPEPAGGEPTLADLPVVPAPGGSPNVHRWLTLAALVAFIMVAVAAFAWSPGSGPDRRPATAPSGDRVAAALPDRVGAMPAPVTYEAEAASNTLGGSAVVVTYPGSSGGRVVKAIGAWNTPPGPGSLRFNQVTAAVAGPYELTFYFAHPNADQTRSVTITVSGSPPVKVTVSTGPACCAARTVTVHLAAGANTVTFDNGQGHAPAIDKIEVTSQPVPAG